MFSDPCDGVSMRVLPALSAEDSSRDRERPSRAGYFLCDTCARNAAIVVS
jgi:hypothetical protein